jgi:hypothetical protein
VRFAAFQVRKESFELLFDRPIKTKEFVVFSPALLDITREKPKQRQNDKQVRHINKQTQYRKAGYEAEQKRSNDQRCIQMIRPISSSHEIAKKIHDFKDSSQK